jgi:phosphoribosylformimino-5-aminoimidazole carboxamide ribonucleotide (ProFAR) isomerase
VREEKPRGELVTVAVAGSLQEADVIRATLQREGIDAVILGELTTSTLSHVMPVVAPHGVRVAVATERSHEARAILE